MVQRQTMHGTAAVCASLQVPQIQKLLTAAASALGLEHKPQLFVRHSQQPSIHYLELPNQTHLPGLAPTQQSQQTTTGHSSPAMDACSNSSTLGSRQGQPVLVVSSRLVEVLQPAELQMMFLTTLSTALAPGKIPSDDLAWALAGSRM